MIHVHDHCPETLPISDRAARRPTGDMSPRNTLVVAVWALLCLQQAAGKLSRRQRSRLDELDVPTDCRIRQELEGLADKQAINEAIGGLEKYVSEPTATSTVSCFSARPSSWASSHPCLCAEPPPFPPFFF